MTPIVLQRYSPSFGYRNRGQEVGSSRGHD